VTNPSRMACRILKSAEEDLRTVIDSLVTAEPEQVESAQRLLEHLVGTLGEIEASVRQTPSLSVRDSMNSLRVTLSRADALTNIGLDNVNRQMERAGFAPGADRFSLQMEA
jgi:hypothetical protein